MRREFDIGRRAGSWSKRNLFDSELQFDRLERSKKKPRARYRCRIFYMIHVDRGGFDNDPPCF